MRKQRRARQLVEEALKEAHRDDVAIHAVYLIPDQHVIVVAVLVAGQRARVAFHHEELSKNAESAAQQARRFVAEELPQLDAATTSKTGTVWSIESIWTSLELKKPRAVLNVRTRPPAGQSRPTASGRVSRDFQALCSGITRKD